ncbi:hypothetical protein EIP91_005988 [Steccherinum ochraceum]|uniref:Uncharacterized protein n=1 Tax=Steccherinum ochraceum TaxID=92696 RepID=A0A4R0R911_9APHY|nr:hypothetical protein EIP91_005988 [Steccherinum ochraceum]
MRRPQPGAHFVPSSQHQIHPYWNQLTTSSKMRSLHVIFAVIAVAAASVVALPVPSGFQSGHAVARDSYANLVLRSTGSMAARDGLLQTRAETNPAAFPNPGGLPPMIRTTATRGRPRTGPGSNPPANSNLPPVAAPKPDAASTKPNTAPENGQTAAEGAE